MELDLAAEGFFLFVRDVRDLRCALVPATCRLTLLCIASDVVVVLLCISFIFSAPDLGRGAQERSRRTRALADNQYIISTPLT